MISATATEMQNNFGRYLNLVISGQEVIVTKNGHEVGRFVPKDMAISYLTDSLTGILKNDADLDEVRTERLKEKYEIADCCEYPARRSAKSREFCSGFFYGVETL